METFNSNVIHRTASENIRQENWILLLLQKILKRKVFAANLKQLVLDESNDRNASRNFWLMRGNISCLQTGRFLETSRVTMCGENRVEGGTHSRKMSQNCFKLINYGLFLETIYSNMVWIGFLGFSIIPLCRVREIGEIIWIAIESSISTVNVICSKLGTIW